MKKFERIFLYSVLAILVCYVFLVDGNVESKEIIQEEIRARSIVIVNDAGQEVIELFANNDGGGTISINNKLGNMVVGIADFEDDGMIGIFNKTGTPVVFINALDTGGGMIGIGNKTGTLIADMTEYEDNGLIRTYNKAGKVFTGMASSDDSGSISIFNKAGKPGVTLDTWRDYGRIGIFNKAGTQVVNMNATTDGKGAIGIIKGGMISIGNEAGNMVVGMGDLKNDGFIVVRNKNGEGTGTLP